jgi:hypothetical protein
MSTHLVATHESTETRDWLCAHCHAFGHVTVHARGEGERRIWFSRNTAADGAHADASVALERDAQRICALIRCPSCGRRSSGAVAATLWYGLKDLGVAITSSVTLGVIVWAATDSSLLGILVLAIAFLVLLAIGDEGRRWREAARVVVSVANPRRSRQLVEPARPVHEPPAPFRSPAAPAPIIATERPSLPSAPIVKADLSADQPTFLR